MAALAIGVAVSGMLAFRPWGRSRSELENLPRSVVRRVDMKATLSAGGMVESGTQTLIDCELENLQFRSQGKFINFGGSSTILSIIPDGSIVKKGDLLCRLDSSEYEELVRQQQLKVEEARAGKLTAELDVQVAGLAVREFEDGVRQQDEQTFRSQIALAESDDQRARDRLAWTERMRQKGYASAGQAINDTMTLKRASFTLKQARGAYEQYQRFGAPLILKRLQNDVEVARATLGFATLRLERHEERLEHYNEQVELCSIRAPHDGFVIYANDANRNITIEEGMIVRQRQHLFLLPDLADMDVRAVLHETVVNAVHEGMQARVRVEALPDVLLEGHVVSVTLLPLVSQARGIIGDDVKNYVGLVRLDSIPRGLRPGMSAEVQIVTGSHLDALVVPPEAVTIERGQEVCYVAGTEGVERREVTVGASTPDLLEVTQGLAEGEEVVLDPVGNNVASGSTTDAPADRFEMAPAE
jgi:HlyD family secretion protein